MIGQDSRSTTFSPAEWTGPASPPRRKSCLQRLHQPLAQVARRGFEGRDHDRGDPLICQKVPPSRAVDALRLAPEAEDLAAGMDRGLALRIHHEKLTVVDMGPPFADRSEGLCGREAGFQTVEDQRTQRGVGHVLAGHCPHPVPQMDTARCHGGGGGGDCHAELAGPGAAGDEREGHASSSGITAVPSISTSQEGRARAVTTTPVETGWTPLMYSPMVR